MPETNSTATVILRGARVTAVGRVFRDGAVGIPYNIDNVSIVAVDPEHASPDELAEALGDDEWDIVNEKLILNWYNNQA